MVGAAACMVAAVMPFADASCLKAASHASNEPVFLQLDRGGAGAPMGGSAGAAAGVAPGVARCTGDRQRNLRLCLRRHVQNVRVARIPL